jgi:rod shape-determining protein MreC
MSKPQRQAFRSRVSVLSLRVLWQRMGFLVLAMLAGGMLVVGQIQPQILTPVRVRIVDGFAPILDAMSRPADLARGVGAIWDNWINVHNEVITLRTENGRLHAWEQNGAALTMENQALKSLLNFRVEPTATSVTARVIATSGGAFTESLIVTAGTRDGVHPGMAAVTADGLIGRVTEVGDWSARILLLTDINSRIPVMVQETGERGVMAGADQPELQLLYLPPDAVVKSGTRIVTSGHGGVFPPQIPVGIVASRTRNQTIVTPIANLGRVHYVRLIDFNLAGGAANAYTRVLQPPSRP